MSAENVDQPHAKVLLYSFSLFFLQRKLNHLDFGFRRVRTKIYEYRTLKGNIFVYYKVTYSQ